MGRSLPCLGYPMISSERRLWQNQGTLEVAWDGYGVAPITELKLRMPETDAVAILGVRLLNEGSGVVTRNFTTFDVRGGKEHGNRNSVDGVEGRTVSIPVNTFREQSFAYMWEALLGSKVNGGGEDDSFMTCSCGS